VQAFTDGATCEQCTTPSGSPLVTTKTNFKGEFTLKNMPVGNNIPVVFQIGKWRRQVTVNTTACVDTPMAAANTRLPKTHIRTVNGVTTGEGNIPKIAITT